MSRGRRRQFRATKRPFLRCPPAWIARANISLPTPVSPCNSTGASRLASCLAFSTACRKAPLLPMISPPSGSFPLGSGAPREWTPRRPGPRSNGPESTTIVPTRFPPRITGSPHSGPSHCDSVARPARIAESASNAAILAGSGSAHNRRGAGPRLDSSAEVLRRVDLHRLVDGEGSPNGVRAAGELIPVRPAYEADVLSCVQRGRVAFGFEDHPCRIGEDHHGP